MIVEHGGNGRLLAEKNGNSSEKWIDFSANINPLGVSENLRQVLVEMKKIYLETITVIMT